MNQLIPSPTLDLLSARLFAPTAKAAQRVLEFFTAQINNDHTRKAYLNATRHFAEWCAGHSLHQLADVQASDYEDLPSQRAVSRSGWLDQRPEAGLARVFPPEPRHEGIMRLQA